MTRLAKTAAYTVAVDDHGETIALGGMACYPLTFGAASGYDAEFQARVVNTDTKIDTDNGRAKDIVLTGGKTFRLWPEQSVVVFNDNNVWRTYGQGRWKLPAGQTVFRVNALNGNDNNDGLATGAGNAKATVQSVLEACANDFDFRGSPSNSVVFIKMETDDLSGVHFGPHGLVGASNGGNITIDGGGFRLDGCDLFFGAVIAIHNLTFNGLIVREAAHVRLFSGCTIICPGGTGILVVHGTVEALGAIAFGPSPGGIYVRARENGVFTINNAPCTVDGGAAIFARASAGGQIYASAANTMTLIGTPAFTQAFAQADDKSSVVDLSLLTFSGAATGKRAIMRRGGSVFRAGTLPGSTPAENQDYKSKRVTTPVAIPNGGDAGTNIASLASDPLPEGEWVVRFVAGFSQPSGPITDLNYAWAILSTTSTGLGSGDVEDVAKFVPGGITPFDVTDQFTLSVGPKRVMVAPGTTAVMYGNAYADFTVGGLQATGMIEARRVGDYIA